MIVAVLVFLGTVSLLASCAAWVAEEGVRRLGIPTRWIWLTSMAASSVLLLGPVLVPGGAPDMLSQVVGIGPVFELLPSAPDQEALGPGALDRVLLIMWASFSLGVFGLLAHSHARLLREKSGWESALVCSRRVYVSDARGPAVAGVLRPWIVLPQWALTLPDSELRLVVLHEEEHVRGGDARLLAAALSLVVVTPWNPVTWWQLHRLRGAMEMDCDRRVLSREPDRKRYGNSLISVAARASGPTLSLASFAERSLSLKRRIVVMTEKKSPWTPFRAGLLTLLAVVVGVQACGVESPFMPEATEGSIQVAPDAPTQNSSDPTTLAEAGVQPTSETPADLGQERMPSTSREEIAAQPTFTPFTIAPAITNRQEVVQAMVREYPPLLREAGIGGTTSVYFFIDETGKVERKLINESSGHPAFDDAALRVADFYDFTPALNGSRIVPVWVSFPITFQVR